MILKICFFLLFFFFFGGGGGYRTIFLGCKMLAVVGLSQAMGVEPFSG